MANRIYIVEPSSEERARLRGMLSHSQSSSQASLKARILLKADQGAAGDSWTDSRICEALETNSAMVERVRQKCVTEGVDAVFRRKPRATPPTARIFDGEAEAKLITVACSEPPEGYARFDYEYRRCGTANLFMGFAPLEGRRLTERFEWHYTPKHGSWLNIAETELSVLSRQCLDRRIHDKHGLCEKVQAWQADRNATATKASWQFTADDARTKLKQLYAAF